MKLLEGFEGSCPFCAGTYVAGYVSGEPIVTHTQPMCAKFEQLDVITYLRAVNEARAN